MPEMRAKSLLMIFGAFHVTNWYIFCVLHQKMDDFDIPQASTGNAANSAPSQSKDSSDLAKLVKEKVFIF